MDMKTIFATQKEPCGYQALIYCEHLRQETNVTQCV